MTPYDWQNDPDLRNRTITRSAMELIEVGGFLLFAVFAWSLRSVLGGPAEVMFR